MSFLVKTPTKKENPQEPTWGREPLSFSRTLFRDPTALGESIAQMFYLWLAALENDLGHAVYVLWTGEMI